MGKLRKETMHEALVIQKQIIASFSCLFVSYGFDTALTWLEMGQSSPAFARLFGVEVGVEGREREEGGEGGGSWIGSLSSFAICSRLTTKTT